MLCEALGQLEENRWSWHMPWLVNVLQCAGPMKSLLQSVVCIYIYRYAYMHTYMRTCIHTYVFATYRLRVYPSLSPASLAKRLPQRLRILE